ncbi:MAG: hypothetical protein WCR30_02765 [Clostridia bacterium]
MNENKLFKNDILNYWLNFVKESGYDGKIIYNFVQELPQEIISEIDKIDFKNCIHKHDYFLKSKYKNVFELLRTKNKFLIKKFRDNDKSNYEGVEIIPILSPSKDTRTIIDYVKREGIMGCNATHIEFVVLCEGLVEKRKSVSCSVCDRVDEEYVLNKGKLKYANENGFIYDKDKLLSGRIMKSYGTQALPFTNEKKYYEMVKENLDIAINSNANSCKDC